MKRYWNEKIRKRSALQNASLQAEPSIYSTNPRDTPPLRSTTMTSTPAGHFRDIVGQIIKSLHTESDSEAHKVRSHRAIQVGIVTNTFIHRYSEPILAMDQSSLRPKNLRRLIPTKRPFPVSSTQDLRVKRVLSPHHRDHSQLITLTR